MGYDDFEGGRVTLFPCYDLGGLWKICNENYIEHRAGGNHFLDLLVSKYKRTQDCFDLLDNTAWPVVMQWVNEDH